MRKMFRFFAQRWVISLLGIIALSLLIWYVGPLFAFADYVPLESEFVRWIVIAIVIVIWVARLVFNKIKSVLGDRHLTEGISQSVADNEPDYGAEEVAQLKKRFEEAIAILTQSRRGAGRKIENLYDLPWYVIIGPPGSGKTTALANSGLEFPLADRLGSPAIHGLGGTRNCDWWFSDTAVLLDTAGRYVTQDSQAEVDSTAWTGFLDLLKKYRPRRPINGVLVALSISDLMVRNEYERKFHVTAIKKRIHELYQHFGMRFPVYFLLTKCDLIAGFTEFFDDLGREERAQVWGMTFPLEEQTVGSAVENIGREFEGLLQRINERLVGRLSQERDIRRRTLMYGFPQQLAAVKDTLDLFLKDIFRPNRFDESVMLRGVYFTSGTQEGTPIDQVMGSLARSFGLNQQALPSFGGQNRAYFITDLLKKVVIPEAQIAGTNRRLERHRVWLQNGAYVAAAGLTALCLVVWLVSYSQNQSYVENMAKQVDEAQVNVKALTAAHRDLLTVLPPLNSIRAMASGLNTDEKGTAWSMGFGLSQKEQLGTKSRATYQRLLNTLFLPRLILRLEEQLKSRVSNPDYLFEALKVYLMLKEQTRFDAETISAWVSLDWDQNQSQHLTEEQMEQLNTHLETLLAAGVPVLPVALDEQLIADVRQTLKRMPLAKRLYGRLKRANLDSDIPSFRIIEAGGAETSIALLRRNGRPLNGEIEGFFTYAGFHELLLPQSRSLSTEMAAERWVVDDGKKLTKDAQALLDIEVRQLYQEEYIARWEALLSDIQLAPITNISRGADILNVLSGSTSPLRQLLSAVAKETSLTRTVAGNSALMEEAAKRAGSIGALSSLKNRLTSVIGVNDVKAILNETKEMPGQVVEDHFASLNKLVTAPESGDMPINEVFLELNELYVYLDSIASATERGQAAMDAVKGNNDLNSIVKKLRITANRQPKLLRRLIMTAADRSRSLIIGGARQHLNAMWQMKPLPFCRRAISQRYPVVSKASQEITFDDFIQFFGPEGVMDSFYNDYLAGFVDTTTVPWQWRGAARGINPEALEQFRRATVIRETFFQGTEKGLSIHFELRPINMDKEITRFFLNLDGQKVTYSHGPVRLTPLQWPGPGGTSQVRLQFLPELKGVVSSVRESGSWAWFRVLDRANIQLTSMPERYDITFNIGGRKARYELHASSTHNPFRLQELAKFRCPEKL